MFLNTVQKINIPREEIKFDFLRRKEIISLPRVAKITSTVVIEVCTLELSDYY